MEWDPQVLVFAPLVVFSAYFVFGMTGFGSSIIAVPLLAHLLPLQFVVPLMALLDFSGSMLVGSKSFRLVARNEMKWLVPFAVIGIILGVTLLIKLSKEPLLLSLGLFVLIYGAYSIVDPHIRRTLGRSWAAPAGLIGGVFTALFGTGGPVYAIYLSRRLKDMSEFRSTMFAIITFTAALRIILFSLTGLLLQWKLLVMALLLLPVMVLGLKTGGRVHLGMSPPAIRMVLGGVLMISGLSLLWKALG